MCHIHESKKPLKMIYFAESINIKDIFPATTRQKEKEESQKLARTSSTNQLSHCKEHIKNTKAF